MVRENPRPTVRGVVDSMVAKPHPTARPQCGHQVCWQAAKDRGGGQVVCEKEDDGCCDHGVHEDDHHGCGECAMERAEWMRDLQREGW